MPTSFTFSTITGPFCASRIADVAQARYLLTLYTSIRLRKAVMVFTKSSALGGDISWLMNASSPKRRGTRTSVFFLNERTVSFWMMSAINNLTALEPISMAAYLTVLSFIFQIIVCSQLGAVFDLATAADVAIAMSLVDFPSLGIVF